jgi:hypothetical protein
MTMKNARANDETSHGGRLGILVLEAVIAVQGDLTFDAFPGSAVRGAVGQALRASACLTGASLCTTNGQPCPVMATCAYGYIWEMSRHKVADSGWFPQPMAPYLFSTPWRWNGLRLRNGEEMRVEIKLIGAARAFAPAVALALRDAFEGWVGSPLHRGRHRLLSVNRRERDGRSTPITLDGQVDDLSAQPTHWLRAPVPDPFDAAHGWLRFKTPLWLRNQERETLTQFDAERFSADLCRRVIHLSEFHERDPIELDWARLRAQAREVQIVDRSWVQSLRETRMRGGTGEVIPVAGIWGSVQVANVGPELSALWKYARWVHVGHESVLGLGQATWEPAQENRSEKRSMR